MKLSKTLIFTILLLLAINTQFLWEGKLGILCFPVFILLFLCVVVLSVLFVIRGYKLVRGKARSRRDVVEFVAILGILCIIAVWPRGIVQWTDIESPAIVKAFHRGVAGSGSALYLKEDGTFRDRQVCFGVYDETGTYRISNDTIYFFSDDYQFDYAVMDSVTISVHWKRATGDRLLPFYKIRKD